jgi:hypothetical protein
MRLSICLLLFAASLLAQVPADPLPAIETLREGFNKGDYTIFSKEFSPELKARFDEKMAGQFFKNANIGWGHWDTTGAPEPVSDREVRVRCGFEKARADLTVAFTAEGKIDRYAFKPIEEADFANPPAASVFFRFPLQGEWTVLRSERQSPPAKAFALDLVRTLPAGNDEAGAQALTAGQAILAPVGGTVAQVLDGIPENAPGQVNAMAPDGNALAIRYAKDEFLSLSHLQPGSFAVKASQKVEPGQALAKAGNSGDCPHPMVTLNVSTNLVGEKGRSKKFGFACVERFDGAAWQQKVNYIPAQGDRLRPCTEP